MRRLVSAIVMFVLIGGMAVKVAFGYISPGNGTYFTMALLDAVTDHVTWDSANNCYVISADIQISNETAADTLYIGPGTILKFEPDDDENCGLDQERCELIIIGVLLAIGTKEAPIIFTSQSDNPLPGDWTGIKGLPLAKNDNLQKAEGLICHSIVEYAKIGVLCSGWALTISNCLIRYNAVVGISIYHSSPVYILNNVIVNNYGPFGWGISHESGPDPTFVCNNTISNNSHGVYNGMGSSNLFIRNNIISHNADYGVSSAYPPGVIEYNDVWGNGTDYLDCQPGDTDISEAPLFADTANGDYHLLINSPCIDRGNPDSEFSDPDSSRNDIGAYGGPGALMAAPSYPRGLTALETDSSILLNWHSNPEADLLYYAIYRDTSSGFSPDSAKLIATPFHPFTTYEDIDFPDTGMYYYRISAVDSSKYGSGYSEEASAHYSGIEPSHIKAELSRIYFLSQNDPNPFNSTTLIHYHLPAVSYQQSAVSLKIYNILGEEVRTLISQEQRAGRYEVVWDGKDNQGKEVSSGVYFYRLEVIGLKAESRKLKAEMVRKMVLLR